MNDIEAHGTHKSKKRENLKEKKLRRITICVAHQYDL